MGMPKAGSLPRGDYVLFEIGKWRAVHKEDSPKSPLAGGEDVNAEQEIRGRVGEDAGAKRACAIRDEVIKRASQQRGPKVRAPVCPREEKSDPGAGSPGERAERHFLERFADEKTKQKAAPKYLLKERYDDDQAHPTRCGI